jgi:alpha-ketoglutarate-dependent taurine dioxygenase
LGAEVKGLDLRRPLDAATVGALHMARAERLVLVFPRQSVSPTEHVCFAGYLGEAIDFPDGSLAIQTTRRSSSCRPYNDFIENRVLHRVTLKGPEIARSAEAAARELEMEAHA